MEINDNVDLMKVNGIFVFEQVPLCRLLCCRKTCLWLY